MVCWEIEGGGKFRRSEGFEKGLPTLGLVKGVEVVE